MAAKQAAATAPRRKGMSKELRENLIAYSFIAPNFIGFCVFTLVPVAAAFVLAFMEWDGVNAAKFVGLANFTRMFGDPNFKAAFWHTIVYVIGTVPATIICALALAMCSGRRKSELCRFRVDDFRDKNLICGGALYKTGEPIRTKGFGLGKYIYCYTLAKQFRPYLDAWMEERRREGIESEWLFPAEGDPSAQMGTTTLNSFASTFSRMTGQDFYWHSLRHYFTTHLSKLGLPDDVIQEIVGWESSDMVRVYKDISAEEQISRFFDADGNIRADAAKSLNDL